MGMRHHHLSLTYRVVPSRVTSFAHAVCSFFFLVFHRAIPSCSAEASSTGVSTGVSTGDDATSTEGGDLKQHRRAGGSGGGGAIAGSSSRVGGGGRKYQYADFVELQRHSGSHSSRSRGAGGVGGGGGGGNGSGAHLVTVVLPL